jgi:hypothetical protein
VEGLARGVDREAGGLDGDKDGLPRRLAAV